MDTNPRFCFYSSSFFTSSVTENTIISTLRKECLGLELYKIWFAEISHRRVLEYDAALDVLLV